MAIQLQAGGGKGARAVRPTMNVTPLVDVVLVLLIIFMVMTPLMTRVLSVHVPTRARDTRAAPPSAADEVQVVLTVTADGRILLNEEPVAQAELADKLRRKFAARADQTLFFDADGATPYGRAVEVLDIARGIGLSTIAVLTESLDG
ncbi:MAG TPA: biopolymer transporter ExbD [Kofleriaceae bacterium]|nr:biopolymer transporter ExbD [Kofleriaceae bacterium]